MAIPRAAIGWGSQSLGQLGIGENFVGSLTTPRDALLGLEDIVQVACGQRFTVVLRQDGTVWTTGTNDNGRLGVGQSALELDAVYSPVQVKNPNGSGALSGIVQVAAGPDFALALDQDGAVFAWGYGEFGQLGNGSNATEQTLPVQVSLAGAATRISAGELHALALLADGTVWAWGYGQSGQLGDGNASDSSVPVQVANLPPPGRAVSDVVGGGSASYAVLDDGAVRAWGANSFGELGDGTTVQRNTPVAVLGVGGAGTLGGVVQLSARFLGGTAVALLSNGMVVTWGLGNLGQLGNNDTQDRPYPDYVLGPGGVGQLGDIVEVEMGSGSVFARPDPAVHPEFGWYGWGDATEIRLGFVAGPLGPIYTQLVPVEIGQGFGGPEGVSEIAAGYDHAIGLQLPSGVLWCAAQLG